MSEEERERFYRRVVSALFGARDVSNMMTITHNGKEPPESLLERALRFRKMFTSKIRFARLQEDSPALARERKRRRVVALKEMTVRVLSRFKKRKITHPNPKLFLSTNDLDMNAILARADITAKFSHLNTNELNAEGKLIKKAAEKAVKKKLKQRKKELKK